MTTKAAEFIPGKSSFIVGVTGVMARFDVGEERAKKWLVEWYEKSRTGMACPRVFRERRRAGYGFSYYTTEAELHAHHPRMRDLKLVRQVNRLEEELAFERRRVDKMAAELAALTVRLQAKR